MYKVVSPKTRIYKVSSLNLRIYKVPSSLLSLIESWQSNVIFITNTFDISNVNTNIFILNTFDMNTNISILNTDISILNKRYHYPKYKYFCEGNSILNTNIFIKRNILSSLFSSDSRLKAGEAM